jgi:hypothetical protein
MLHILRNINGEKLQSGVVIVIITKSLYKISSTGTNKDIGGNP